ncbi:MAG TPA: hypothetical protein DCS78_02960, partial [Pseudoalteromonas shioyasakiensis]|nr:hypothetical protein [Pseudoalteromonas shioyasakiensis]
APKRKSPSLSGTGFFTSSKATKMINLALNQYVMISSRVNLTPIYSIAVNQVGSVLLFVGRAD